MNEDSAKEPAKYYEDYNDLNENHKNFQKNDGDFHSNHCNLHNILVVL